MISIKIKQQILEREQLLADRIEKDQKVLNDELVTLILSRLKIDMKGNYIKHQDNMRLTSPDMKIKLEKEFNEKGWINIRSKVDNIGEIFEDNILKKRTYYPISRDKEKLHCVVITEMKESDVEIILNQKDSEETQMSSWIAPYWHESDIITFSKEKRNIEIIFC